MFVICNQKKIVTTKTKSLGSKLYREAQEYEYWASPSIYSTSSPKASLTLLSPGKVQSHKPRDDPVRID